MGSEPTPRTGVDRSPSLDIETPRVIQTRRHPLPARGKFSAREHPLSVGHLLLWLTFVGVYLGIVRRELISADIGSAGIVFLFSQAMMAGLCWAGLSLVLFRSVRRVPLPTEPGHWFLVILGVRFAIEFLLRFTGGPILTSPEAVASAATCLALVLPTFDRRMAGIWKASFVAQVLLYGVPLLFACVTIWLDISPAEFPFTRQLAAALRSILCATLPLAVTVWLAHRDMRSGWLHWIGVSTWLVWHVTQPLLY